MYSLQDGSSTVSKYEASAFTFSNGVGNWFRSGLGGGSVELPGPDDEGRDVAAVVVVVALSCCCCSPCFARFFLNRKFFFFFLLFFF